MDKKIRYNSLPYAMFDDVLLKRVRNFFFTGGHKEFHTRHKELCENTLLPPLNGGNVYAEDGSSLMDDKGSSDVGEKTSSSIGNGTNWLMDGQQRLSEFTAEDLDSHPTSRVLPYLYLGNAKDAADFGSLQRLGINRVLNVTSQIPGYHEKSGIVYKQLPATDSSHQNLKQYFEQAFDFIGE